MTTFARLGTLATPTITNRACLHQTLSSRAQQDNNILSFSPPTTSLFSYQWPTIILPPVAFASLPLKSISRPLIWISCLPMGIQVIGMIMIPFSTSSTLTQALKDGALPLVIKPIFKPSLVSQANFAC
jgi:hypothetical protein